jgi:hypothetical protein
MNAMNNGVSAQPILAQLTGATALQRERGALHLQRLLRGEAKSRCKGGVPSRHCMRHGLPGHDSDRWSVCLIFMLQIIVYSQRIGKCS